MAGTSFKGLLILLVAFPPGLAAQVDFRVLPYLQNPAPEAITIVWFSNANRPGRLTYAKNNTPAITRVSTPVLAAALAYSTWEYANNLAVINARHPDFIVLAGDLVESGGEQRDWDEFWRHQTHADGAQSLAGRTPLLAAPGNHEYYEGPELDGYNQPGSERAINKFRAYFDFPKNASSDPEQEGRYYRLDYGPVTLIALDVANGSPHRSNRDTNFHLLAGRKIQPSCQGRSAPLRLISFYMLAAKFNLGSKFCKF